MRFSNPIALVLLAAVVWMWLQSPGTAAGGASRRLWRAGALLLLVLAASGLEFHAGDAPLATMIVLDRSDSMAVRATAAAQLDALTTSLSPSRPGDRTGLVLFGASAVVERPLGTEVRGGEVASAVASGATDIAAGLRAARAALPADGFRRMLLLSDGRQTSGDVLAEAARSGGAGVPIDVVVSEAGVRSDDPVVAGVSAPTAARIGEPYAVVVTVHGKAETEAVVVLRGPDGERRQDIRIPAGRSTEAVFTTRGTRSGVQAYEATLVTKDEFAGSGPAVGAAIAVSGEPRLLYVGGSPGLLSPAIDAGRFSIVHVAPGSAPATGAGWLNFDVVVLDNVAPGNLAAPQATALRSFVEQHGGGLLVLGGRESLEPGAWAATPLAGLLPVDFRPRAGRRAPATAFVVAFDKSGSMDDRVDGVPRIEFARQAVRRVFDAVPASDAIGVIAFDAAPSVVAPLASGQDAGAVATALAAVSPSGATSIAPAIDLAAEWLRAPAVAGVARRHVLLVSDGRTTTADAARLEAIVARGEFELSVVALGADADRRLLEALARRTGGRAYFPRDIRELPAIAARESTRVTGGRLVEERFQPRALPHQILAGIDTQALPPLGGYVVGAARAAAQTAIESALGDPILATGSAGLGRVAVYSADLHSAWSAAWPGWRGFSPLFTHTLRWISRRVGDDGVYVAFIEDRDGLRLVVEAQDGTGPSGALDARAAVRAPSGDVQTVRLQARAPGRYEALMANPARGLHVATISIAGPTADDGERRVVRGAYWSGGQELGRAGDDRALLARIAEVSGGRVIRAGEADSARVRPPVFHPLRRWLAAAALLLFLLEVLLPTRVLTTDARGARRQPDDRRAA